MKKAVKAEFEHEAKEKVVKLERDYAKKFSEAEDAAPTGRVKKAVEKKMKRAFEEEAKEAVAELKPKYKKKFLSGVRKVQDRIKRRVKRRVQPRGSGKKRRVEKKCLPAKIPRCDRRQFVMRVLNGAGCVTRASCVKERGAAARQSDERCPEVRHDEKCGRDQRKMRIKFSYRGHQCRKTVCARSQGCKRAQAVRCHRGSHPTTIKYSVGSHKCEESMCIRAGALF